MAEARISPEISPQISKGPRNLITDVAGLSIGNAQDMRALTGVTVLLTEEPGTAAMDVRGGAPGTRESDALDPRHLLEGRVDAIVLSGGSVYGLDAPSGVTQWLGKQGRGFAFPGLSVTAPIVPGAILFDLANGGEKYWADGGAEEPPYRALGYAACEVAGAEFALGNAGAGLGAVAGTYKGGLGSASAVTADGITVGALVAVNAVGSPVMPGTDCFWAAPFELDNEFGGRRWNGEGAPAALDPLEGSKLAVRGEMTSRENTTIGIIATDAALDATAMHRIAVMAHDGFARALRPAHAPMDGDAIFALSTGKKPLDPAARSLDIARLGAIAADCMARAIARGVFEAESLGAIPSWAARHGGE